MDRKIEINKLIINKLETFSKTLYDYWFVQFNFPNSKNKPYKVNGEEMTYNREFKNKIPNDWSVVEVKNFENNIITGKTPPTKNQEYYNGDIPFICIDDIRGNMHVIDTKIKLSKIRADYQKMKFIPKGALCVTCIASPGLLSFATEKSQTNQQINSINCKKIENSYYLYFYLSDHFKFAKAKQGNILFNMNKGEFSSIKIINPTEKVLKDFYDIVQATIDKVRNLEIENNKLKQLIDLLIPMTLSGQIKLS